MKLVILLLGFFLFIPNIYCQQNDTIANVQDNYSNCLAIQSENLAFMSNYYSKLKDDKASDSDLKAYMSYMKLQSEQQSALCKGLHTLLVSLEAESGINKAIEPNASDESVPIMIIGDPNTNSTTPEINPAPATIYTYSY